MSQQITRRGVNTGIGAALLTPALAWASAFAQAKTPIKIGFSMALTGSLAGAGQQALLGAKIWEEDVNAKGGPLGRPVKLVNYDDQTNPSLIPGIYTKLMDVDKVDLVTGPYGTNLVAPAIPVVMQKGQGLHRLVCDFTIRNISPCCRPGRRRSNRLPRDSLRLRQPRTRNRKPLQSPQTTPSSRTTPQTALETT